MLTFMEKRLMGEHNLRGELTEPPADLTQEQAEKLNNPSSRMERLFERERQNTDFIHSGRHRKCLPVIHTNHNIQWRKGS